MLILSQVRRLVFLVFLLALSLVLLWMYPSRSPRESPYRTPPEAPPRVEAAPAPPPSPFPPGAVIFHGALEKVEDLTSKEGLDGDPAYLKLVDHVAGLPEGALRASSEGELAYATYLRHAPELRGRVFRVRGMAIHQSEPERLSEPVRGREDVYRIYLAALEEDAGFICDLVEPASIEKTDQVSVEGLFYKVVRYENTLGRERDAPLLIGRAAEKIVYPPADPEGKLFLYKLVLVTGIAAALIAAYFLFQRMARTRYATFVRPRRSPPGSSGEDRPRSG